VLAQKTAFPVVIHHTVCWYGDFTMRFPVGRRNARRLVDLDWFFSPKMPSLYAKSYKYRVSTLLRSYPNHSRTKLSLPRPSPFPPQTPYLRFLELNG
jgi:hypothetical protein